MSQTLVGSRGVTTSRAGSAAIVKRVCPACRFTMHVVDVDGERVEADAELLAVVTFADDGTVRRVNARRLHADTCAALHPPAPPPRQRRVVDTYRVVDARKRFRSDPSPVSPARRRDSASARRRPRASSRRAGAPFRRARRGTTNRTRTT